MEFRHQGNQGYQWFKKNVDARIAISIVFFEPQIFTDFTDFCYALGWSLNIRVIRDYQWLKINVDARRALSIIFFNLRFLLIEQMFATQSRFQENQVNQ